MIINNIYYDYNNKKIVKLNMRRILKSDSKCDYNTIRHLNNILYNAYNLQDLITIKILLQHPLINFYDALKVFGKLSDKKIISEHLKLTKLLKDENMIDENMIPNYNLCSLLLSNHPIYNKGGSQLIYNKAKSYLFKNPKINYDDYLNKTYRDEMKKNNNRLIHVFTNICMMSRDYKTIKILLKHPIIHPNFNEDIIRYFNGCRMIEIYGVKIIKLLLEKKIDLDSNFYYKILNYISSRPYDSNDKDIEVIQFILEHFRQFPFKKEDLTLEWNCEIVVNPIDNILTSVCLYGNKLEIVKLLLQYKNDVELKSFDNQILINACLGGNIEIVKLLLEYIKSNSFELDSEILVNACKTQNIDIKDYY